MTASEIYHMLKSFIGYGNPSAKYWFIGMEEHWDVSCCEDITQIISKKDIDYYSKKVHPLIKDEKTLCEFRVRAQLNHSFEGGIKRILHEIEKKEFDIILPGDTFFATNIRFMPVTDYKKIRTLFNKDKLKYEEDEKSRRQELLKLWLRNQANGRITFCLSKNYKKHFEELFNNEIQFNSGNDRRIEFADFNYKKIYLMDHPRAIQYFNRCINELKLHF